MLLVAACGSKPPAAPPVYDPVDDIGLAPAGQGPVAAASSTTPSASPTGEDAPLEAGWVTTDYQRGLVEYVGHDRALDVIKKHPTRVLAKVGQLVEECSSTGGSHAFFEVAFSKELAFQKAHLGGHGSHFLIDKNKLYVMAVETHTPSTLGGKGWCIEGAPRYDADVVALVPVRSEGEGMRLLSSLER